MKRLKHHLTTPWGAVRATFTHYAVDGAWVTLHGTVPTIGAVKFSITKDKAAARGIIA